MDMARDLFIFQMYTFQFYISTITIHLGPKGAPVIVISILYKYDNNESEKTALLIAIA